MRYWKSFVESFEGMTNQQIITACKEKGLTRLSSNDKWQSRTVFALNDHWVIKVSNSIVGRMQTLNEIELADYLDSVPHMKKYFCAVHPISTDNGGRFVIMRRVDDYRTKEIKRIEKLAVQQAITHDTTGVLKAVHEVDKYMGKMNLQDLGARSFNCGTDNKGRIRVLDFGGCRQVMNAYLIARRERGEPNQREAERVLLKTEF